MLPLSIFYLVASAGISFAEPTRLVGNEPAHHGKGGLVAVTAADVRTLELYSQYAAATYCNNATAAGAPIACEANCDRVLADAGTIVKSFQTDPGTDIAGYVALVHSRKQIIFAARGTASDKNWNTNLNILAVKTDLVRGGVFHKGFYDAWMLLSEGVRAAIDEVKARHNYSLVVVGHSLGGAIATIGAAHLRADGYRVDLYTYGQPRVGNEIVSEFITNQPGRLYRVTHGADPVPRLPPTWLGYRHTSPEVWLMGNHTGPSRWPLKDIKVCEGSFNTSCNANGSIPFNAVDHGVYFGKMSCFGPSPVSSAKSANGVYIPKGVDKKLGQGPDIEAV